MDIDKDKIFDEIFGIGNTEDLLTWWDGENRKRIPVDEKLPQTTPEEKLKDKEDNN